MYSMGGVSPAFFRGWGQHVGILLLVFHQYPKQAGYSGYPLVNIQKTMENHH